MRKIKSFTTLLILLNDKHTLHSVVGKGGLAPPTARSMIWCSSIELLPIVCLVTHTLDGLPTSFVLDSIFPANWASADVSVWPTESKHPTRRLLVCLVGQVYICPGLKVFHTYNSCQIIKFIDLSVAQVCAISRHQYIYYLLVLLHPLIIRLL